VHDELAEGLEDRVAQAELLEPLGRCGAGRRLALADLVAIDDQGARPGVLQLSRARVRPANDAPQISTSQSRVSGVRCAPRFVARVGIRADHTRAVHGLTTVLRYAFAR
jgi:hypothetical protein